jgi:hypothetical protein
LVCGTNLAHLGMHVNESKFDVDLWQGWVKILRKDEFEKRMTDAIPTNWGGVPRWMNLAAITWIVFRFAVKRVLRNVNCFGTRGVARQAALLGTLWHALARLPLQIHENGLEL